MVTGTTKCWVSCEGLASHPGKLGGGGGVHAGYPVKD